jgi:hypothetical protein
MMALDRYLYVLGKPDGRRAVLRLLLQKVVDLMDGKEAARVFVDSLGDSGVV